MKHSAHTVKLRWKKFPNFRQNLSAFVRGWQLERFWRKFGNLNFHHNLTLCTECSIGNYVSRVQKKEQLYLKCSSCSGKLWSFKAGGVSRQVSLCILPSYIKSLLYYTGNRISVSLQTECYIRLFSCGVYIYRQIVQIDRQFILEQTCNISQFNTITCVY